MNREKINSKNENFIGCWTIDDKELFKKLINFFESNPGLQNKGHLATGIDILKKKV